ncbi:hypothetical protein METBIDRAFT_43572 [Metschnikowia bicuspidata var. bicuspidata NRRL YB-4993]|uniref:WD40 repeat-like protein n=1 Tax=Metschnikowia bicuspidata var. bicuspidata NRRL YB-4993 TaxID=869754 RepID=A0A1A0H907_9ASCO|nr:hypothetical protein METBIDRAFT_43572 [Metschnikowia bicuspidata var. bicuspidata NRRL YB-4993]OBA20491.1 hypothetical protein METBIDRAFT_43572 [Metschnikowia bicuspidata var. bicuspidata NRRL YB-4993]
MLTAEQNCSRQILRFSGVQGTTARMPAQFAVLGEHIAYVAGSGVIVATVGEDNTICNQRLFVANSTNETHPGNYGYGLGGLHETAACEDELRKDLFGFPLNFTHCYRGTCAEAELSAIAVLDTKEPGTPSTGNSKLKDKVRAPTCLAISPNGRVLAVGETGYQPRLLLFSLAPDSSAQPFAVIYEHTFGINHIEFSPNLKYFCSLGTMSDGFIHVWKYSPTAVVRRAGNKCSSIVNALVWHDTGSEFGEIITLGLRFLKVWLLELQETSLPSKVAVLKGRNLILGKFLESNFQGAVPLNESQIIIRESTAYYLLNLMHNVSIQEIALDHLKISGIVVDHTEDKLWVFDQDFSLHSVNVSDLELLPGSAAQYKSALSPSKLAPGILRLNIHAKNTILKAQNYGDRLIAYLTGEGEIVLHHKEIAIPKKLVSPPVSFVVGGKRASTGEILMFSKHGVVSSLDSSRNILEVVAHRLPQAEGLANEMTAVERNTTALFLGDKFGLLTVLRFPEGEPRTERVIKAHSSSINDIIYFEVEDVSLLCSISRDRMIQIYCETDQKWDILATLPIHTANLLSVKFIDSHLFVCSADRSISVHEIARSTGSGTATLKVEIIHKKTIPSKTTPLAMDVSASEFVISSSDRSLSVYNKHTLEFKRTVKLYGEKSTEPLCVDRFLLLQNNQIAVFCSDRSLRVCNLISGKHLNCVWGHLELVIGLFEDSNNLLSLGSDGCLFEWSFLSVLDSDKQAICDTNENTIPTPDPDASPLFAKVTRKFLPTIQMSKIAVSPRRAPSLTGEDVGLTEPESPTPRLTNATLKRIEARKNAQTLSASPSKPSHSHGSPVGKSPFRSKSVSPPKKQPSVSQTPFNRGQTPSRQSPLSRSLHVAAKTQSSVSPQKSTAPLLLPPTSSASDARERSTAYLTMIKSFVKKDVLDEEDKEAIKSELEELLILLDGPKGFEALLEKYSESLVSLVKTKLSNDL